MNVASLLLLLWSLVEVRSQTVPYVSFMPMSQTPLANNSYVDISLVGNDGSGSDSVQCITDLATCCTNPQGSHRGDWYFPDGTRLPFNTPGVDIYELRQTQRVDLRHRNNANSPVGIYRCDIPTNAVHDDTDTSVRDRPVYVGLYTVTGGDISISGGVTFDPDQLTLTCISTGGPATTVTWTRDSTTVTQGTETVLNDPVTANYTHTLAIATAGDYTCMVSNNKPSSASATITVTGPEAPTGVTAVQDGPTSILVSWSPSTNATGYTVSYTGGGSSGSVDVSGGDTNSHNLTGLTNGETYTMSIVATSNNLDSDTVTVNMAVGLVPGQPTASLDSTTATTVSLSWSVPSGSVVDEYLIEWTRDTSVGCFDQDTNSTTITATSHTIPGLEEDSRYTITVTASNGAGTGPVSNTVTAMTEEAAPTAPPSSVNAMVESSTSITVQWGSVPCIHQNGAITGYSVQYGVMGSGNTENMTVNGASTTQTTISGLNPSTTYSIRVAAVNNQLIGTYSSSENELTEVAVPVLAVESTTATSISLSWTSAGSEGVMYEVNWQRDTSVGCTDEDTGSTTITGGSMTTYTITGLEEDSRYIVNMTAYNSLGDEPSNQITAMTLVKRPTAAPMSVTSSSTSSSTITVQWGEVPCIHQNGAITGYSVQYGVMGSGSTQTVTVNGADVAQMTIENLMSSTTYSIEVAAVNSAGTGEYSDPRNQLTRVEAPVVTVDESSVTATSVPVSWTSGGSEGVSYVVEWTSVGECPGISGGSQSVSVGGDRQFTIVDLEEYITYSITVRVTNSLGSVDSTAVNGRTSEARPSAPPIDVTADGSSTTITVQWGSVPCIHQNGAITGYSVQYGVEGSGSTQTLIFTGNGAEIPGLVTSTNYTVQVAAITSAGVGEYSDPPLIVNTETVITLTIVAATTNSILIQWDVIEEAQGSIMPSGYNISYRNTEYTDCFTKSNTISIPTDSLGGSYNIVGLEEGIENSITVALLMGGAVTDRNTILQATAEAAPSAPPSEVMVAGVTSSTITVVWGEVPCIHQNGDITGYSVQYGVMGSGSTENMTVDGDSSGGMATISGLEAATMYEYQVAGRTIVGPGQYSSPMTTLTSVRAPTVIDSSIGPFSISISWTSSGPVVERYEVEWQRDTSGDCPDEHTDSATVSGGSERSYDITSLFGDSSYSIRVDAMNAAGSAISDPLVVSTTEAAPTAPPGCLSPSSVTPNSFSIQWGRVPCIHRNGDITGYSVLVQGNGSMRSIDVNGPDVLTTDISGLMSDTMYLVQVAGVNGQGTGVYRDLTVTTPQTVYLNFGGMNLPTNGLVNISQLGNSTGTGLICSTDQSADGTPAGGWFNPDGSMLSSSSSEGFFVSDGSDGVYLLRGSGIPVEGIYTCSATDSSGNTRTVFVGLYNEQGGEVGIDGEIGFTLVSELTAVEPQFTLSCNSTDGPATSVIWTRGSDTVGKGTTVLNDAVTAHYTHTLTVTGRLGGVYVCTVSNSISTTASSGQNIEVASSPTNVMVTQETATSFMVSWTPPSPLGDTTGYTISYAGGGSSGSVDAAGGSTDSFSLTGLDSGETYTISLIGRSRHIPGAAITAQIVPIPAPGQVFVSVSSITATSISLSWSVSSGRVASWEVVWRPTDRGTENTSGPLSGTTYTILQLDPSTIYTFTVSATNVAGTTDSTPILFSTCASNDIQARSSSSESESGATIGGVVGAVLIIAAATIVLHVAIALLLRRRRGNYSTSAKRRSEMVDAPGSAATVLELSKIPDETSPFHTTSNEAYNVVRGTGRTAEDEYEIPQNLPPPTTSSQPAAGDHFYEPV